MTNLLSAAGRSFLRVFVASLVILLPGVLAAPDVSQATALAWAACIASVTAALKAVQVFAPRLTVGYWLTALLGKANEAFEPIEDAFVRAFVGTFITLVIGVLAAPDFSTAKSLAIGACVGALSAGIRAIQAFLTLDETPVPKVGLQVRNTEKGERFARSPAAK